MSESSDYDQGDYKGVDFSDARKEFATSAGRSYSEAVNSGKTVKDLIPQNLSTESSSPLVIVCDVTGSMGEWPTTIFSKLGYLNNEGKTYLGNDMEISFAAIGDAYSDKYALQGRPFAKGTDLAIRLKELVIEGGGGPDIYETYELAALYYARNVATPKAIRKPVIIFIGDENPYDSISASHAKNLAYVDLQGKSLSLAEVFNELKAKYSVFMIRKPYGSNRTNEMSSIDSRVHKKWAELLGEDNVKILPDAGRVVDVIFGILAEVTNKNSEFREDMEKRQTEAQRNTVYKSLGLNADGTPKKETKSDKKNVESSGGKSVLKAPKKKPGRLF